MAYLNLLASVPEPDVVRLRRDPVFVATPSLVVGVSHLIGYWTQVQPLGGLLGQALDGGEPIHPDLWHPLRAPVYHPPGEVAKLTQEIREAWLACGGSELPEDDWLAGQVAHLLRVFDHAAGAGECVVSALDFPADRERADYVRLPWSRRAGG